MLHLSRDCAARCSAGSYELKKICKYASNKNFTHLFVVSEKKKKVNGYGAWARCGVGGVRQSAAVNRRCVCVRGCVQSPGDQAANRPHCVFQVVEFQVST